MKRAEIMGDCPEEFEDRLKEIIDYFEQKVNEIRDKLDIDKISELSNIEEAFDLAYKLSDDLY